MEESKNDKEEEIRETEKKFNENLVRKEESLIFECIKTDPLFSNFLRENYKIEIEDKGNYEEKTLIRLTDDKAIRRWTMPKGFGIQWQTREVSEE